jgi:hypothetical protein
MIQKNYLQGQVVESLLTGDNNLVLEAKVGEVIRFQQGIVRIMMDINRILMGLSINKILVIFLIFMQVQELRNQN